MVDSPQFNMFGPREIATVIFKHKYKMIVLFAIVASAVLVYALSRPTTYDAKARILVKFGREFVAKSEIGNERQAAFNTQSVMSTEIEIVRSSEVASKVIEAIGPEKLYPELQKGPSGHDRLLAAIAKFNKNLRVMVIPTTSMIEITFSHPSPTVGVETLNLVLEYFKEKHLQVYSGTSTVFLEKQFKDFSSQLKESEMKMERFKQQHGVFSLDEQRSALIQQRNVLETSLLSINNQIKELEFKTARLKSAQPSGDIIAPEVTNRLAALYGKEQELLQTYKEDSRAVQSVRAEIQSLMGVSREFADVSRRAEIKKMDGELATLKTRADVTRHQINQLTGQLQAQDLRVTTLQELKRNIATQESSYQTYLKKLEEGRISDDMDRQKLVALKVVEEANAKMTLVEKSTAMLFVMGLFGGILSGIALAFLLEFLSPVMTTPLDAERRLGLPVMVSIPKRQLNA